MTDNFVKMEPSYWGTIQTAMAEAQDSARKGTPVEFDFNRITVRVSHQTNLEWLLRDYHTAFLLDWSIIGPDPQEEYTDALKMQISEARADQEQQRAEQQRIWPQQRLAALSALEEKIHGVEFSIKPGRETALANWRTNSTDGCGAAIIDYAIVWAKLMQERIQRGYRLQDVADATSHEADTDGITGFMYGAAVKVLTDTWVFGHDLAVWHNAKYVESFWDVLNEGSVTEAFAAWQKHYMTEDRGVVNPAIFTIAV